MLSSIQSQPLFSITGIKMRQIIFDNTDQATLLGDVLLTNEIQCVKIHLSFGQLNDFLRFSGENGDLVLMAMVDALANTAQPPYSINVEEVLPGKNVFTQCHLQIKSATTAANQEFQLLDSQPINLIQQSKNLQAHLKNFGYAQLSGPMLSLKSIEQLRNQFAYYLGLLELDIREDAARIKAQIVDERLFTMAKVAFGMK